MEIKPVTLRLRGNKLMTVEGFYFKIEIHGKEIELAGHLSPDCKLTYDITHAETGFSVCRNFLTLEQAISHAEEKIKELGIDQCDQATKKANEYIAAHSFSEL